MRTNMKQFVELTCDGLDDMGRGVCHTADGVYFIAGLLPSEKCQAHIAYYNAKKKLGFGEVAKLLSESSMRVKPTCPGFPYCGCALTHLDYEDRLKYKQETIHRLCLKFGRMDLNVLPTIPCPVRTGFRNKVQKPIGGKKGDIKFGFYKPNSHCLVPCEYCESESELSRKISHEALLLLNKYGYEPYDEDTQNGQLRHILIKTSKAFEEALVTLVSTTLKLPHIEDFAKELAEKVPQIKGVILNLNSAVTNVILGVVEKVVYGVNEIHEQVLGKTFKISSKSFFQTNPYMVDTLYKTAIEALNLSGGEKILDAYCGTGTIGICMAEKADNVTGVEVEDSSVLDARANAKSNNIHNIYFHKHDATEFMLRTKGHFDIVVLDPPRKGTTPEFIDACIHMGPKKVAYISCDPSTLARDLKLFSKAYKVDFIRGVDMFPTTHHIETVAILSKK